MIERILKLNKELDGSIFLFGARQTGKSTILFQQFSGAIYIDLLDTEVRGRFSRQPVLLYEMLKDKPEKTLCFPFLLAKRLKCHCDLTVQEDGGAKNLVK